MANSALDVGDIVKLSADTTWRVNKDTNPLDCTGEVALKTGNWVTVKWASGFDNSYLPNDSDLILIESP